jgi:glycosyltransferase involved in cell wall biosynthesis
VRILYLSQYFPPEAGATQARAHAMARDWVKLGHRVTVIAEIPNHPSGRIAPEYRGRWHERAMLDDIDVIRVWVKCSPRKTFGARLLFYVSYALGAVVAGLTMARGRFDLIYASSPPLTVGAAALAIAALRRVPLVFEVRDLWPEMAVTLGELAEPRAIAWAERLERACYRRARAIVVVTEGLRQRLLERGLNPERLWLVPNGSDTEVFRFRSEGRERLRNELGLGDAFVAIYAGLFGLAYDLDSVLRAASLLRDQADLRFLLVGDGPRRAEIAEQARELGLSNLTLLPQQPVEAIPDLLSAADLALVPPRNLALLEAALPCKMFDAWACERPVALTIDGEARSMMERIGAGVLVAPGRAEALVQALLDLKDRPEARAAMGRRGRAFTVEHHSRAAWAQRLIGRLESLIGPTGSSP